MAGQVAGVALDLARPPHMVFHRLEYGDPGVHLRDSQIELAANLDELGIRGQSNVYRPLLAGREHFE
jgi:hypothetical protein